MWKDMVEIMSDERSQFERNKNVHHAKRSPHVGQIPEMHCAVCPCIPPALQLQKYV